MAESLGGVGYVEVQWSAAEVTGGTHTLPWIWVEEGTRPERWETWSFLRDKL